MNSGSCRHIFIPRQECFPRKIETTTSSSSGYFPSGPRVEFPTEEDETSKGDSDLRRQTGGAHRHHHHHDHDVEGSADPEEQPRSSGQQEKLPKSVLDPFSSKTLEEEVRTFDDFINNGLAAAGNSNFRSSPSRTWRSSTG